ncbi:hypothetical protein EG835_02250 [bacterium]|nr:hypothetical protein [bacterium]
MKHRILAALGVSLALVCVPAIASAMPLGDALSALPASPAAIAVTDGTSVAYKVTMAEGEILTLSLALAGGAPEALDLDLYLYGPGATVTDHGSAIAKSIQPATGYPEAISYQALTAGTYYVEVFAYRLSGTGTLTWAVSPEPLLPVYRFYNNRNATHFYTASETERANVQNTLGHVFTFEGAAYYTKATKNSQYLHRFYNRRAETHFYTASESERERVATTMASTFTYEGTTYKVSTTAEGGKAPVYRFYNRRNGSHFYTASESEMNTVRNTLGHVYAYEGPAFFLGR